MPGIIEVGDVRSALHVLLDLQVTVCDQGTYSHPSRLQKSQTPFEASQLHIVSELHPRLIALSTKTMRNELSIFARRTKKC